MVIWINASIINWDISVKPTCAWLSDEISVLVIVANEVTMVASVWAILAAPVNINFTRVDIGIYLGWLTVNHSSFFDDHIWQRG